MFHTNRKLNETLFLLIIFSMISLTCLAQTNYQNGYYITWENDTVQGIINNRGETGNFRSCIYKKDDYNYGYDRLTRGIGLNQSLGYMFIGDSRIWNFYGGLDFSQSWSKNVRDVNFDTRMKDDTQHFDLYFGFKIAWVIPIYRSAPADFYYN